MQANSKALVPINNAKYAVELAAEYAEIFPSPAATLALANAKMALGVEENKACLIYWAKAGGWRYLMPNGDAGPVMDRAAMDDLAATHVLATDEANIDPIFEEFGVYLYAYQATISRPFASDGG